MKTNISKLKSDGFEVSHFANKGGVDFNPSNHTITIKDINGFISVKGEVLSHYKITLYTPTSEVDTVPTEENTIDMGGVFIKNGTYSKVGAFNKQEIRVEQKVDEATFVISHFDAVFNIPENIDVDDVTVNIESHGGVDELKMFNDEVTQTNSILENNGIQFNLIPNPTTKLNVGFSYKNQNQNDVIKMKLFDRDGNLKYSSVEFLINQDEEFETNLNLGNDDLKSGMYYVTVQNNSGMLLFKRLQINE